MRVLIIGELHYLDASFPRPTPPGQPPYPDQGLPQPPLTIGWPLPTPPLYPSQGPGFPTNPIAPGGLPPRPDQGLPGQPPYPSQGPGFPTQLPVFPSDPSLPPTGETLPIERDQLFVVKWSPMYGWILVPVKDDEPVPTPHKKV